MVILINEDDLKTLVLGLEYELLSPETRHSETRLRELLADEFVEFGASGRIYDKQSIIDSLLQSEPAECFEIRDFRMVSSVRKATGERMPSVSPLASSTTGPTTS